MKGSIIRQRIINQQGWIAATAHMRPGTFLTIPRSQGSCETYFFWRCQSQPWSGEQEEKLLSSSDLRTENYSDIVSEIPSSSIYIHTLLPFI